MPSNPTTTQERTLPVSESSEHITSPSLKGNPPNSVTSKRARTASSPTLDAKQASTGSACCYRSQRWLYSSSSGSSTFPLASSAVTVPRPLDVLNQLVTLWGEGKVQNRYGHPFSVAWSAS